jgi:hypothetical protein
MEFSSLLPKGSYPEVASAVQEAVAVLDNTCDFRKLKHRPIAAINKLHRQIKVPEETSA